jgi:hypothetical protein
MADKHDGGIRHEGLVLMARPVEIQRLAKHHDDRAGKNAIEQMKASHAEEGLAGVSMPEGNSAVARAKNRHQQSFEPFKIPE